MRGKAKAKEKSTSSRKGAPRTEGAEDKKERKGKQKYRLRGERRMKIDRHGRSQR
ncbi:MAG: hypothetical protein ACUZ8N_03325 [Candidatus Scalindua sp.]